MSHYVVYDWMTTELGLKGLEKELYAIIYGFSQDGESEFYGSLVYLSRITGATKRGIQKALTTLVNDGKLTKREVAGESSKYRAVPPNKVHPTHELSSPNNKENNKITLPKGKGKFSSYMKEIEDRFEDTEIIEELTKFLRYRISIGLTVEIWREILDELYDLASTKEDALKIIRQSLLNSYKKFYPLKKEYRNTTGGGARETAVLMKDSIIAEYDKDTMSGKFFGSFEEWKKERGIE